VQRDIANLRAAVQDVQPTEVFMCAASPGVIAGMGTTYYSDQRECLYAVADAMREEYQAIVTAGFLLQVDCPDLAMVAHTALAGAELAAVRGHIGQAGEALTHALAGIPAERVRVHVCWGNYPGPHHRDVPLKDIIDLLLALPAAALSIEAANPGHGYEWEVFEDVRLPEGKVLIPGVIDTKTNGIEHPRLVAQRLVRYAHLVGAQNLTHNASQPMPGQVLVRGVRRAPCGPRPPAPV
jgi:5-methyltetrahydropteroyltriglutamate--homocysteine methyltransferase